MDVTQMVSTAQDAITVRRVYSKPYEKDGVTIITAARLAGGVGGGSGQEKGQEGEGGGCAGCPPSTPSACSRPSARWCWAW
jgi:uncharacterized spore protein YtfJ